MGSPGVPFSTPWLLPPGEASPGLPQTPPGPLMIEQEVFYQTGRRGRNERKGPQDPGSEPTTTRARVTMTLASRGKLPQTNTTNTTNNTTNTTNNTTNTTNTTNNTTNTTNNTTNNTIRLAWGLCLLRCLLGTWGVGE